MILGRSKPLLYFNRTQDGLSNPCVVHKPCQVTLQHHPHHSHVVLGMSPVALGIQIAFAAGRKAVGIDHVTHWG